MMLRRGSLAQALAMACALALALSGAMQIPPRAKGDIAPAQVVAGSAVILCNQSNVMLDAYFINITGDGYFTQTFTYFLENQGDSEINQTVFIPYDFHQSEDLIIFWENLSGGMTTDKSPPYIYVNEILTYNVTINTTVFNGSTFSGLTTNLVLAPHEITKVFL
jgi:hypothetical protein